MRCPFLDDDKPGLCTAAPPDKPVRCPEPSVAPCHDDQHRYCWLYMDRLDRGRAASGVEAQSVDLPCGYAVSPNHMWFDLHDDGTCHVGLDAFAVRALAPLEFGSTGPAHFVQRPQLVLRVRGHDFRLVFPNPIALEAWNPQVMTYPELVETDPYGEGWLFRGRDPGIAAGRGASADAGLARGQEARTWLDREAKRFKAFVRQHLGDAGLEGAPVEADGGLLVRGLVHRLDDADLAQLYDSFLSPQRGWIF